MASSARCRCALPVPGVALTLVMAAVPGSAGPAGAAEASVAAVLDALVRAYPDELSGHDGATLIWRDGTRMQADDGRPHKSFEETLRSASILDQMRLHYPKGSRSAPAGEEDDPGRFRNQAFFDKIYGDCSKQKVEPRLETVIWMPGSWGKPLRVTSVNAVAAHLRKVSAELEKLPPLLRAYAYPSAGTYNCRPVAENGSRSMHAYGAAIDLNVKYADYWLWRQGGAKSIAHAKSIAQAKSFTYANRMPFEIVDIFERHGFIWGGRWGHYDTMHFEYRPELLDMAGASQ
ncbi:D-alanyl-D-alanine carboxypeptidase [Rhizobiales bacterium GAS191]|nr:D-alanyl-D-alanine carboxypeptidase [Rhizobiales bacterium GAS191]